MLSTLDEYGRAWFEVTVEEIGGTPTSGGGWYSLGAED